MKTNDLRFAGFLSIALAFFYILVAAVYVIPDVNAFDVESFKNRALNLCFVLIGICGIGVVRAVAWTGAGPDTHLSRWLGFLAYAGFGIAAFDSLNPTGYVKNDIFYVFEYDPHQVAIFGAVGVWLFGNSAAALFRNSWPVPLSVLGMLAGTIYLGTVGASLAEFSNLFMILSGIGGVLVAPLFYVLFGFRLLLTKPASEPPQQIPEQVL